MHRHTAVRHAASTTTFLLVATLSVAQQETAPNLFDYITRSELVEGQLGVIDRYRQQPAVIDVGVVRIEPALLAAAQPLNLQLPGVAAPILLDNVRLERNATGTYSWFGDSTNVANSVDTTVILVVGEGDEIAGVIRRGTVLYRLRSLGRVQLLVAVDEDLRPPRDDHPQEFLEPSDDGPQEGELGDRAIGIVPHNCRTVRLLIAYTPRARVEAIDSYGSIRQASEVAISQANDGYHNSRLPIRLELAHAYETDYAANDWKTALKHFLVAGDDIMDDVHGFRDDHQADVAILMRGRTPNDRTCGVYGKIHADASTAFAVVAQDCAVDNFTLGHEVGHLQGARHNPEADGKTWPFRYGHGYHVRLLSKKTIMARTCPGVSGRCPRINYLSNPDVELDGATLGTEEWHNNARVLRETACRVSRFR